MADFRLEVGLNVASGEIDSFIQSVQGQINKKKITIPFAPDQYSVQAFSKRLSDELKKSGVEIRAKANAADVKTFIRELQGQLNKSAVLSIPFVPAQHSIQEFAQKLQQEINKADVKVEVKVDAKQAKQAASGVDDAKKKVTELNSVLKEYYQLSAKEIKLGSLGGEEYEAVAKRLEVLRSRLSELGVSTEELRTAFDNNSLKGYIQSLTGVELTSEQLDKITKTVTDGLIKEAHAMDQSAKSSRDKADADRAAKEAEEAARKAGQERLNTINKLTTSVKSYITAFLGFATVTQLVKKVYDNVLQLDKAVVDLQIATGKTRDEAADLVKQYSALGQQLGVQTKDVAESAVAWLRQGNSIEDTNKLIVASTMLSKLGRIEVSEATKDLTSTMKGYGIEVNDVISIIDRLTAVDLKAATSAGDIATAMQKTAVTANQVGIPLERLIGMVATLSEVSQQSPETVGTGMKSMLARMVNIKAGHLEDPETGEALNNVESALRGVGIQLRDVNGQFRNTNDVLEEVAGRWKSFTSLQQNAVAVSLGGTRQQENVRILMEYWDKVVSLTDVASNSAGTAEKKFEAYTEGIEARIESLKAAWQSLSDTVLSSDFVKGAVDVLTKIVNLLDGIPPILIVIGGLLTKVFAGSFKTGMTAALAQGATYLGGMQAGAASAGATFTTLSGAIGTAASALAAFVPYLAIAAAAVGAVAVVVKTVKSSQTDWNKVFEDAKAAVEAHTQELDRNKESAEDYTKKLQENKDRLNELNKLKDEGVSLSLAQQDEIDRINIENNSLKTQIDLLKQKNEELKETIGHELELEVAAYGKKEYDLYDRDVDEYVKRTIALFGGSKEQFEKNSGLIQQSADVYGFDMAASQFFEGLSYDEENVVGTIDDLINLYSYYTSMAGTEMDDMYSQFGVNVDAATSYLATRIRESVRFYEDALAKAIKYGNVGLAESIRKELEALYKIPGIDKVVDNKPTTPGRSGTYNWRSNNAEIVNEAEAEARKQVRAIAGIRAAVLAEQQRAVNISRGIFDFETYDDAWYAQHFPDFEQQRNTIIKAYPALEEYFELWGRGIITGEELAAKIDEVTNAAEKTPTNKDAFNSVKAILDADWDVDKQAAVASFGELAQKLGATEPQVKAMMDALMATSDKNMILDSLIMFFEGVGVEGVDELVKKLKDLKETVEAPAKPGIGDYWQQFKDAVSAFDKAANPSEKTKAIADMIDTLAKAHLDQDVFDKILGHILDLKAGNIDLAQFKDLIYDLAQEYPEFAKYADIDWDDTTPPPTVKDAFSQLKEVFEADWSSDKDAAIDKLSEMATRLGVNSEDIEVMKSLLQDANLATNKNSVIDMIIAFLQSSNIEHADELIQHLLELRDATPATKNRSELSGDFISAVGGFKENGSKYDKNVAGGQITAAARAMFGGNSEEYAAISDLVNKLVFGKITVEEFHNAIAELTKGTVWENFIPQDWFKKAQDTSGLVEGLTSDLNSLMSQGSDAQRKNKFDEIVKSMSEIEGLAPEVQGALKAAMESYLENQDEDAFKAEIARIFGGDEALRQYILDSWLPNVKTVKTEDAIKSIISDINSMQKEDTQQGRDEYYKKIIDALATLGVTAENAAGTGLFDFLQALQAGTLNGEEFESQIYSIADALSELLKQLYGIDINLRNFLPDQEQPESLQSRLATAMGTPQQIMPQYSDTFNSAKDSLMGLGRGDMITSEEQAVILQQLPQLSDEFREYAAVVADSTATDFEKQLALENLKTAFMGLYGMDMAGEFRSSMEDLVEGMEDLDEGSLAYAEGIESIADAYGIATDTARDYFDELQAAVDGSTDAWSEFQKAATEDIFANVELQGEFNTDDLLAGLYTVQDVINATGWTSEELQEKLIANGLFEEVPNQLQGKITIPEFNIPGTDLHFGGAEVQATYDQPLLKPTEAFQGTPPPKKHGGGGKKKSPKTGGKTSILSEQYTNDKGLYDTLIDNLKNLNNLYEEGSEEWLRNQQRIIETYQAYAKTIQDEYDRLVKAGVDMTDKEMQTLAKDLLKVNKEMYNAAKEYWEAVRDNMKESMQHIVDQMDAVLELRDAHKDLLTSLRQENRELEKQYKIAQDEAAHPGLTEAEREMLFSTEDYKRLTGMLKDISEQADALYEEYRNKIASVTEDETYAISYITDEYERQLGLLESQYEIAKQQLAVEKARQELQNTLRERNTAVLINGAWTWMADPDAVQAAMEKVADAEVELEDAITDAEYNKETAEIETARDAIKSSIDAMEALEFAIEDLADGIVDLADAINEKIFNSIGTTSRNYLNQTKGHGLEMFMNELTELQETSGLVFSNSDVERLYSLLSSGNTITSSNVFDDSIVHDSAAIASILNSTTNSTAGAQNVIYINGIQLSDADSEMLLNALDRVAYTWQA